MSSTVKKVGILSLAVSIALVSILASCHAINRSEAMMAEGATQQPLLFVVISPDASQECCLLAPHNMPASLLASTSERSDAWYLIGTVVALFTLWRLRDKDQSADQRVPTRERGSLVFRFLQEAFARGIIHSRIYEPVFV